MNPTQDKKTIVSEVVIQQIIEALSSLKYGHVHITVHNSRVVQIDKTEKTRFDDDGSIEQGGGI